MSCAGCDDCPQDAWHLHVTVRPHRTWGITDLARAIEKDMEHLNAKLVRVTNVVPRGYNYTELIPTRHVKGTEAAATESLFRMTHLLSNSGWQIKRMKIEGHPASVAQGRALYYEAHAKIQPEHVSLAHTLHLPISMSKDKIIATLRYPDPLRINDMWNIMHDKGMTLGQPLRIEAAVLDTNPDLDREWMMQ